MFRYLFLLFLCGVLVACEKVESNGEQYDLSEAAEYNVDLGLSYLSQNHLELAEEKLSLAAKQDPTSSHVLIAQAYFFQKIQDPETAEKFYQKALMQAPEDPHVLNNYGAFLCQRGKYSEGINYLQLAKAKSDDFAENQIVANLTICQQLLQKT